jgi:signal recognition particle receptor subunit beta
MSGQGNGRSMWKICYNDCLGLVIVIDSSDKDRLDILKSEIDLLLQSTRSNIPILFLANKNDIADCLSINDCTKGLGLDQIKQNHKIFSTCAVSGCGIEEAFGWLRNSILQASSPRLKVNPME